MITPRIGYARASILDQHPEIQTDALTAAGCEELFTDHGISDMKASRPELDRCPAYLRKDDQLVVWRLDRPGRSVSHLVHVVEELRQRGVQFTTLTERLDAATAQGRLTFPPRLSARPATATRTGTGRPGQGRGG